MSQAIESIIDLASQKCDEADLYFASGENRSIEFENNTLKHVHSSQHSGLGLRVISNGRIGFASTTDLRKPEQIVDMALESAGFGEKAVFDLPASTPHTTEIKTHDKEIENITLDDMVDMGREGLAMSRDADDAYLYGASISASRGLSRLLNTKGVDISCEGSSMSAGVGIEVMNDGGILDVYEYKSWSRPFNSITELAKDALDKMKTGSVISKAESRQMPIVFTRKAVGTLLAPLLSALNGKLVQKGASLLADKIGEQVADKRLNIFDDPHVDWAPGSAPYDDEGLPSNRMDLIKEGVVKNYLLDLQTAGLLNMPATGNGGRSTSSRPSPSTSNIIVSPGQTPYEDIIRNIDYGLIIDQTLGSGQSNTLAGEFSVNVALGFLVENGEIKGRVKDCMVAGNVYDILTSLEAIGSESLWLGSSCAPDICVGGLKLAVDDK